jgi:hypothetical protein
MPDQSLLVNAGDCVRCPKALLFRALVLAALLSLFNFHPFCSCWRLNFTVARSLCCCLCLLIQVMFRSDVWHRGGGNTSGEARHLIQVHYCDAWSVKRFQEVSTSIDSGCWSCACALQYYLGISSRDISSICMSDVCGWQGWDEERMEDAEAKQQAAIDGAAGGPNPNPCV